MQVEELKNSLIGPDSDLDDEKKEIIQHREGPALIIAGPGSGKTRTLVDRTIWLIGVEKVPPEKILISTFTEKAARELYTRLSNRLLEFDIKANLNEMYFGTLHSIFLRFLEEYKEFTRLKSSYRVLDQFDQKYLLFQNFRDFESLEDVELLWGNARSRWQRTDALLKYINKANEEYLNPDMLLASNDPQIQAIGRLSKRYRQFLEEENLLDFSTIQVECLNLLENYPDALSRLSDQIQYMMIDEYQDTNTIQERILLLLAGEKQNICVVGDDDQGLYRFRGATIRNILEFQQNFLSGHCRKFTLNVNYRSHPGIIDFYNRWISLCDWRHNGKTFRHEKTIIPPAKDFPDYNSVVKVSADTNRDLWFAETLAFIRHIQSTGQLTNLNQIAFLFRSVRNQDVIALAQYLELHGIPVFSPRSSMFFQRPEIRLMMGALVFLFPTLFGILEIEDDDHLPTWEYYRICKRFFANTLRSDQQKHQPLIRYCQRISKNHIKLLENTDYAFSGLFYQLLQYDLFADFLQADLNGQANDLRPPYNLGIFSQLLTKYEYLHGMDIFTPSNFERNLIGFFKFFLRFLYDGGMEEYEDFEEYAPSGSVSFMTIHQSKGLEFPIVFVGSLSAVPRTQYTEVDMLLESDYYHRGPYEPFSQTKFYDFWRLYYTAFSRSQNMLILTAREKTGHGRTPSKYIEPIYRDLIDWDDSTVNLSSLVLDTIKTTVIKHQYSFTSDILLYENCPLQYKFFKELEFSPVRQAATMFGTLVHQTIEDIHRAVLTGREAEVTPDSITNWFNLNYHYLVKAFRTYLRDIQLKSALDQVLSYNTRHNHDWSQIREAEVDVSLVKDDYVLKGTIDLIRGEEDTVEVVDFKSEKKPDVNADPDREKLLRNKRQLEVYAHLVEQRTGYKVSKLHLYYTSEKDGNPYVSFEKNHQDITQTIDQFDRVVALIEKKEYDMEPFPVNKKQCENCDMRYHCHSHCKVKLI